MRRLCAWLADTSIKASLPLHVSLLAASLWTQVSIKYKTFSARHTILFRQRNSVHVAQSDRQLYNNILQLHNIFRRGQH